MALTTPDQVTSWIIGYTEVAGVAKNGSGPASRLNPKELGT
jgi:hypothetical protein